MPTVFVMKPDDEVDPLKKYHICHVCYESFINAQSLGGHKSRKHPNTSDAYKKKMARRDERVQERQILELAK